MRKIVTAIVILLQTSLLLAQDLISKIPANANVVATINTGKLFQLMPADEWNNSKLGKKLLEMSSKNPEEPLKSVTDIGINLSSSTYYFHTENDSLQYNYILVPLSDAIKFDAFFKGKPFSLLANNTRIAINEDSSSYMMWNEKQLLYVSGVLKEQYFRDSLIAARNGFDYSYDYSYPPPPDTSYSANMPAFDTAISVVDTTKSIVEESAPAKSIKPDKTKTAHKKTVTGKKKAKQAKNKKPVHEPVEEVVAEKETEQPEVTTDRYSKADTIVMPPAPDYYDKNYFVKRKITAACTEANAKYLFSNSPASAITTNAAYLKTVDTSAVASIWMDNPMNMYYSLLPSNFLYGRRLGSNFLNRVSNSGYKSFNAKLLFEEKQLRLSSAAELTDDMSATQQKIWGRKLNKKFLKYVNTDSVLGYMSWSMDTKAYLENFPKMLENTYGRMGIGLGSDEYAVFGELMSFLIDEEAISKLIKGDGMVFFNGLYQQQTTYTDYVYDENYKSTAVQKTKTDTLPKFVLMLSSDENNFERKLISYGIKKEVVKQRDGFYELAIPGSPVSLYFLNKDGIFFLTNSITDLQSINADKFIARISKDEKKLLLSRNYTMYINPSKIAGEIATTEVGAAESLSSAMNTFRKMGNIRAVMLPVQGNVIGGELTMDVPPNNRSSVKYIFDLFEGFIK